MTPALTDLIERARTIEMTPEERERQRRSFAYGNVSIENDLVTRAMVDECAEALRTPRPAERGGRPRRAVGG